VSGTAARHAVVATVAYSDVFDVAVDEDHLFDWLIGRAAGRRDFRQATDELVASGQIGRCGDLYHLPGRELVVETYRRRRDLAERAWPDAVRWGRRLGRIPFVRMVAVTGGLACDSIEPHDDMDFLIVATKGRVWTARALIGVVVRVAALSNLEVCPNYVLAEDALALSDRNTYVARELIQMRPLVNPDLARRFREENQWLLEYLPNADLDDGIEDAVPLRIGPGRRVVELILKTRLFDRVERGEMRRRSAKLLKVESRRPEVGNPSETDFTPAVCKGHLAPNGSAVGVAWSTRLAQLGVAP
jgi:hypothetical protein